MIPRRRSTDIDPTIKGRADLEAARATIQAIETRRLAETASARAPLTFAAWLEGR